MIQVVALNYILNNKDTELLSRYGEEYYFKYTKEYNFIKKHYAKYGGIYQIKVGKSINNR